MYIVGWVFPDRMLKASTLILERRSQVGNSGNCWGGYGVRVETMGAAWKYSVNTRTEAAQGKNK